MSWRRLTRGLAWLITRFYYRSFRVEGAENVPGDGPVLLVVNHPNSLLDAAALLSAVARPVRFGAKEPLFHSRLWGPLLRGTDGIPIHRREDPGADPSKNRDAYAAFVAGLHAGDVCAIFPEGFSHLEPRLSVVKAGAAKIALTAQRTIEGAVSIAIVPAGLSFRPAQAFRGEVLVKIGEPFSCADVVDRPLEESIPVLQQRIRDAIQPLMMHMERPDLAPLAREVARAYRAHQRAAGHDVAPQADAEHIASRAFNHFLDTDPAVVHEVRHRHAEYVELAGNTSVNQAALHLRERKVMWALTFLGLLVELVLGLPIYVFGVLVGVIPLRMTEHVARKAIRTEGGDAALPLTRVVVGAGAFGAFFGLLTWLFFDWSGSHWATLVFLGLLIACTLFTARYRRHASAWKKRLLALSPAFVQRKALARAAEARQRLVWYVHQSLQRYEEESGYRVLPSADDVLQRAERRQRKRVLVRRAAFVVGAAALLFLASDLRPRGPDHLIDVPSPWTRLPEGDARRVIERDAHGLAGYLDALAAVDRRSDELRREFRESERDYYTPQDDIAVREALGAFLRAREGLVRIAWYYRETPPGRDDALRARALVLAHTSAVELCAREMQFIDTFSDDAEATRKLNEADPARGVPAGMLDKIRARLADSQALETLAAGASAFADLDAAGRLPSGDPWDGLIARAKSGAGVVDALSERVTSYRLQHTLTQTVKRGEEGIYAVSSVVSTWIGDARVRQRPGDGGLISHEQVEELRAELRPGDILIERRNWYMSNAFLPGYWPHGALYVGGRAGIEELGLADDPRVSVHLAELERVDPHGGESVVIESMSEGVVFTSLEYSVGGADAVCVLRPRSPHVSPERVREAVARAISHYGKPYDFDFDFFSTDRLVCTEVIHQAYGKALDFELVEIMGRKTLPALQIVRRWAETRDDPDGPLELIAFLDADEDRGIAVNASADTLVETLDRPALVLLEERRGRPRFLSTPVLILVGLVLLTLWYTRGE